MNGVVAFTGGATLPVGAAVLALSALPALRRPRDIKPLLLLQAVLVCSVLALGIVGMLVPSAVPSVPKPGSRRRVRRNVCIALSVSSAKSESPTASSVADERTRLG